MRLIFTLAARNLVGAGLRTWLNAIALSLSFVVIIFLQGMYNGMNRQAEQASVGALYGGGQYWHTGYDPFDPFTLTDAHGVVPAPLDSLVGARLATAILIRQATIYPNGRFRSVLLKGIPPDQTVLTLPTAAMQGPPGTIAALIGERMAKSAGLKAGDEVTVQWRDVNGTFDAADVTVARVMRTTVQEVDNDQIWVPLERLRVMTDMPGQATLVVIAPKTRMPARIAGWDFKDQAYLLRDIHELVRTKSVGASILYIVLLFLAMLAIFDTQVLSIFRRRKEIGTLMALGMTRERVIALFTVEGMLHAALAAVLAIAYGMPLFAIVASKGFEVPQGTDSFGIAIGERIFPVYSAVLVAGTTLLVFILTTIVSFLPTRQIAKLKPTDALRGKAA